LSPLSWKAADRSRGAHGAKWLREGIYLRSRPLDGQRQVGEFKSVYRGGGGEGKGEGGCAWLTVKRFMPLAAVRASMKGQSKLSPLNVTKMAGRRVFISANQRCNRARCVGETRKQRMCVGGGVGMESEKNRRGLQAGNAHASSAVAEARHAEMHSWRGGGGMFVCEYRFIVLVAGWGRGLGRRPVWVQMVLLCQTDNQSPWLSFASRPNSQHLCRCPLQGSQWRPRLPR